MVLIEKPTAAETPYIGKIDQFLTNLINQRV